MSFLQGPPWLQELSWDLMFVALPFDRVVGRYPMVRSLQSRLLTLQILPEKLSRSQFS